MKVENYIAFESIHKQHDYLYKLREASSQAYARGGELSETADRARMALSEYYEQIQRLTELSSVIEGIKSSDWGVDLTKIAPEPDDCISVAVGTDPAIGSVFNPQRHHKE
jgi:hypothetical protein